MFKIASYTPLDLDDDDLTPHPMQSAGWQVAQMQPFPEPPKPFEIALAEPFKEPKAATPFKIAKAEPFPAPFQIVSAEPFDEGADPSSVFKVKAFQDSMPGEPPLVVRPPATRTPPTLYDPQPASPLTLQRGQPAFMATPPQADLLAPSQPLQQTPAIAARGSQFQSPFQPAPTVPAGMPPRKEGEARISEDPAKIGKKGFLEFFEDQFADDRGATVLSKKGTSKIPFAGPTLELVDAVDLIRAARRVRDGEGTAADERRVAEYQEQEAADAARGTNIPYKIADIVASMPAFAVEFAKTGGAYFAVRKSVQSLLTKAVGEVAKKKAAGFAIKAASSLVGAAAQTPLMVPRIAADTARRMSPTSKDIEEEFKDWDDDFMPALLRAVPDMFVEVASERTGGVFKDLPVPKRIEALKTAVMDRWLKLNPSKTLTDFLAKVRSDTAWNGVVGETFEEYVGQVARAAQPYLREDGQPQPPLIRMVTGEQGEQKSDNPRLRAAADFAEELLTMGVAFAVPGVTAKVIEKLASRKPATPGSTVPPPGAATPPTQPPADLATDPFAGEPPTNVAFTPGLKNLGFTERDVAQMDPVKAEQFVILSGAGYTRDDLEKMSSKRVGDVVDLIKSGYSNSDIDALTPNEVSSIIASRTPKRGTDVPSATAPVAPPVEAGAPAQRPAGDVGIPQQEAPQARPGAVPAVAAPGETASWVIREKGTGKVIMETFDPSVVAKINTERYEAVPILPYLQELNRKIKDDAAKPYKVNDRGNIDLSFATPPTPDVETRLKDSGWTLNPKEKTWYAPDSPERRQQADVLNFAQTHDDALYKAHEFSNGQGAWAVVVPTDGEFAVHRFTEDGSRSRASAPTFIDAAEQLWTGGFRTPDEGAFERVLFNRDKPTAQKPASSVSAETVPEGVTPVPVATAAEAQPGGFYLVKPKLLKLAPQEYQYKSNANAEGITAEDKLDGPWDKTRGGVILVQKRGDDLYVVNGHHRTDLANRLGADQVIVHVLEPMSVEEARTMGALANIGDDKGTPIDAAKVIRGGYTAERLQQQFGINPRKPLAKQGLALANLSEPIFQRVISGDLAIAAGVAIGESGLSQDSQMGLLKLIQNYEANKNTEVTPGVLRSLVEQAQNAPEVSATGGDQPDIFGEDDRTINLVNEKADLQDWVSSTLGNVKRAFKGVSNAGRAALLKGAGNKLNEKGNKAEAELASVMKAMFDQLANKSGPINKALNIAAQRVYNKEDLHAVRQDLLNAVRDAVAQELGRPAIASKKAPDAAGLRPSERNLPETPKAGVGPAVQAGPGVTPPADADAGRPAASPEAVAPPAPKSTTRYRMIYRPPGSFTLPRGLKWELVERPSASGAGYEKRTDLPVSAHPFGVFTSERELTPDEMASFEIEKVDDANVTKATAPAIPTMREAIDSYRPLGSSTRATDAPETSVSSSASFTASMTPMARGRAESALDKSVGNGGRVITRRALVEETIGKGATVQTAKSGERRLTTPDGAYLAESQISKIAMDYAEHLQNRDADPQEKPKAAPQKKEPAEPRGQVAGKGTSSAVRDHPQTATVKGDTITVTSYDDGRNKVASFTIPVDEWVEAHKFANPNYSKRALVDVYASELDTESGGEIRDAMVQAIDRAFKAAGIDPTSGEEADSTDRLSQDDAEEMKRQAAEFIRQMRERKAAAASTTAKPEKTGASQEQVRSTPRYVATKEGQQRGFVGVKDTQTGQFVRSGLSSTQVAQDIAAKMSIDAKNGVREGISGSTPAPRTETPKAAPESTGIGAEKVGFGKYGDLTVDQAIAQQPGWADWIVREGNSPRARKIAAYIRTTQTPAADLAKAETDVAAVVTPEARASLEAFSLTVTPDSDGGIYVGGKTYDLRSIISSAGGRFIRDRQAWRVPANFFAGLVAKFDALPRPERGRGRGLAAYVTDPQLARLREIADGRADDSDIAGDIGRFVGSDTVALLNRGLAIGMPEVVTNEQIEDVARIHRAYAQDKSLFVLASEPGSGKTFVLGGAIRELLKAGAKRIQYVTLRTELITQIKQDLADYGIDQVEFITYPKLRTEQPSASDVLIFDEAHSIKNVAEGDEGAAQAKAGARWIANAKFTIFATATPFENPTQAAYLEPTGVFETPFKGFEGFAHAFGASTVKVSEATTIVVWRRTSTSDQDAAAARQWFIKQGIYTSRRLRLPKDQVDSRLVKINVPEAAAKQYAALTEAAAAREDGMHGFARAWIINFQKRLLEASKVAQGIAEAKDALARGRFPIIFVETKAERRLDIPDLMNRDVEWQLAVAAAQRSGEQRPSRRSFGLPPAGVLEVLAAFMDRSGTSVIEIPPASELVEAAFPGKVAVFTGPPVSPAVAQRNLDAWRSGEKPVLLATMAKGGTGLSLHDKVGDHQTTQININLPWTATQVVQVAQRSARYGLKGQAEIQWIFADNIPFDRVLSNKVGGRMADMGALVHGERSTDSQKVEDWDFDSLLFSETTDTAILQQEDDQSDMLSLWNAEDRDESKKEQAAETPLFEDERSTVEDTLSTGEAQPRLPGDVGEVRDREVAQGRVADVPLGSYNPQNLKVSFNLTDDEATTVDALMAGQVLFDKTDRMAFDFGAKESEGDNDLSQSATRLSVLHNIDADEIVAADKIGGLVVPSLAITPEDSAMKAFGEITLIGRADLGNPAYEPIYDSDVYSMRFPQPEYPKVSGKVAQPVVNKIRDLATKFEDRSAFHQVWDNAVNSPNPGETISTLIRSHLGRAWFLREHGEPDIAPIMRDVPIGQPWVNDAEFLEAHRRYRDAVHDVSGGSPEQMAALAELSDAARAAIDRYVTTTDQGRKLVAAMEAPKRNKAQAVAEAKRILGSAWGEDGEWVTNGEPMSFGMGWKVERSVADVGKRDVDDPATREMLDKKIAGRESEFKSWIEAQILPMYGPPYVRVGRSRLPFTMENIVKAMTGRVRGVEGTATFGEGKARAMASKKFSDLEQMRRAADRQIGDAATVEARREDAKNAIDAWRDAVLDYYRDQGDTWRGMDASMRAIASWVKGAKTENNLRWALAREGFRTDSMPPRILKDGVEAGKLFWVAPVPYFEAKPQRAVRFSEFAGAVIPKSTSAEARAVLDKHGIPYVEYDRNTGESAREDAVVAFRKELADQGEDVLFQSAWHGTPHQFDKFSVQHIGSGEGAQAYGWGLYFGGNKAVAEYYKEVLTESKDTMVEGGGRLPRWVANIVEFERAGKRHQHSIDQALAEFKKRVAEADEAVRQEEGQWWLDADKARAGREVVQGLENAKAGAKLIKPGRLIEVDIPEDEDYLNWDKPIEAQSAKVKAALAKLGITAENRPEQPGWTVEQSDRDGFPGQNVQEGQWLAVQRTADGVFIAWGGQPFLSREGAQANADQRNKIGPLNRDKGEYIYRDLAEAEMAEGSVLGPSGPEKASRKLASVGIVGIRYFDGASRAKKEGDHNYVIFDDSHVKIVGEDTNVLAQDDSKTPMELVLEQQQKIHELKRRNAPQAVIDHAKQKLKDIKRDTSHLDGHVTFETGKPVTFKYVRNAMSAPDMGERFGQHLEPAGRYMQQVEKGGYFDGLETGEVTFKDPLVIDFGGGYQDADNWKRVLSEQYGGSTGLRLSKKLVAAGYDGIVTMGTTRGIRHSSEIVDLTPIVRKYSFKAQPKRDILAQAEDTANAKARRQWYYSNTAKALTTWQAKGTSAQLLAHLGKVKGAMDEAETIGLTGWLKEREKVTRDEVQRYLDEHQVQVQEVHKADQAADPSARLSPEEEQEMERAYQTMHTAGLDIDYRANENDPNGERKLYVFDMEDSQPVEPSMLHPDVRAAFETYVRLSDRDDNYNGVQVGAAKYGGQNTTTPGGTRYREVLLTLPPIDGPELREASARYKQAVQAENDANARGEDVIGTRGDLTDATDRTQREFVAARELAKDKQYRSSHWDEPNVLAHIRMNDRTIDGRRTLFIEEWQSDLHRDGRKLGYKTGAVNPDVIAKASKRLQDALDKDGLLGFDRNAQAFAAVAYNDDFAERWELSPETKEAADAYRLLSKQKKANEVGVPDAPFKGNAWKKLVFKKALSLAADGGYDAIAWVSGKITQDRYDLSKHVSKIELSKSSALAGDTKYRLTAFDLNGDRAIDKTVEKDEIPNVIGKDASEKLLGGENAERLDAGIHAEISGLDLKVGGEWAINLYDKEMPNLANEIGKKFGAKATTAEINIDLGALKKKYYYQGPSRTVSQVREGAASLDSVQLRKQLNKVADLMDQGSTFQDAMSSEASHTSAEVMGGKFIERPDAMSVHMMVLPTEMKETIRDQGLPLFQGKKGEVEFVEGGKAILRGFKSADVSTALHEMVHVARRLLFDTRLSAEERAGITDADIITAAEWAGAELVNGRYEWSRDAEEKFARGFEKYLRSDRPSNLPNLSREMANVFRKISKWLTRIYAVLQNSAIDVEISEPMAKVFDRLVTRADRVRAEKIVAAQMSAREAAEQQRQAKPVSRKKQQPSFGFDMDADQDRLFQQAPAVESGEFKKWFMDSHVSHSDGTPMVMHHASPSRFTVFNTKKEGAHFGTLEQARNVKGKGKLKTKAFFLSIQNPLRVPDLGTWSFNGVHSYLSVNDKITDAEADKAWEAWQKSDDAGWESLKDALRNHGYDGFVYDNEQEGQGDSYVAFEPTQIKSVDNRGTFNPKDPNILHQDDDLAAIRAAIQSRRQATRQPKLATGNTPPPIADSLLIDFKEKVVSDWQRVKELAKTEGLKRTNDLTPAERRQLMSGRQTARLQETEETVKAIDKDILDTAKKVGVTDAVLQEMVYDFLKARHAPERNAAIGPRAAGISDADAATLMATVKALPYAKEVERLAEDIQTFHNETLDILYANGDAFGVIDKKTYDDLRKKYEHHVPLNRVMDSDDIGQVLSGRGLNVRGSGLKKAVGSERDIRDLMENIYAARTQAIQRIEKNIVDNETYQFVQDYIKSFPEQELFELVTPKAIGKDFQDNIILEPMTDPLLLTFRRHGKQSYIKINDARIAVALQGVNREQLPGLIRAVASVTRVMSSLVTRFSPEFPLSNKIRDLQEAVVFMASQGDARWKGAAKMLAKDPTSIQAVTDFMRGKDTPGTRLYKQMIQDGGTTGGLALSTRKQMESSLEDIRKSNRASSPRQAFRALAKGIDHWNGIFEDSTRLSAYRQALELGMSRDKAALMAKNVSIDFNEFGTGGPLLNAAYMFSNASIQGNAKMIRAMKDPKVALAVIAMIAAAVFAADEWNDDRDPEWKRKVSKWDRLNGLNIVLPGTETFRYISIPVSWGLKPIKVAFEYAHDLTGQDKPPVGDIAEGILTAILSGYNPLGGTNVASALTPSALRPVNDVWDNRSWSGGKIHPDWDAYAPASTEYFPDLRKSVSGKLLIDAARKVSDTTGGRIEVSPADADYVLQQLTGGPGRFTSRVVDTVAAIGKGETPPARNIPFAGRIVREVTSDRFRADQGELNIERVLTEQSRERFYERQEAERLYEEVKKLPPAQRVATVREVVKGNQQMLERIQAVADEEAKGLTRIDRQMLQLGVENGERAKYLAAVLKATPVKDRKALMLEYAKKAILTPGVEAQVRMLLGRDKITLQ